MKTKPKDYAFPAPERYEEGLTKREYFAALAIQNMVHQVTSDSDQEHIKHCSKWMATAAVSIADALIEALNEK